MNQRAEAKEATLNKILDISAMRLRVEGLAGAGIAAVMQQAGLTHGGFYVHFANKGQLLIAALQHALRDNRPRWVGNTRDLSWSARLQRLARRYLTKRHRDDRADSCALAALAGDAARAAPEFRQAYEAELLKSLRAVCAAPSAETPVPPAQWDQALVFMALCIGGLTLSRAVVSDDLSQQILAACRQAAAGIVPPETPTNT